MNDANAIRKRVAKYVGPVTALAFLFNFVKFFEADVSYYENWSNKTGKTKAFDKRCGGGSTS